MFATLRTAGFSLYHVIFLLSLCFGSSRTLPQNDPYSRKEEKHTHGAHLIGVTIGRDAYGRLRAHWHARSARSSDFLKNSLDV